MQSRVAKSTEQLNISESSYLHLPNRPLVTESTQPSNLFTGKTSQQEEVKRIVTCKEEEQKGTQLSGYV